KRQQQHVLRADPDDKPSEHERYVNFVCQSIVVWFLGDLHGHGDALDGNGKAVYSTSTLARGPHSITASYGGDARDTSSTSSVLTETVNPANTTITLASSANPSTYGSLVTFSATVKQPTATGTV